MQLIFVQTRQNRYSITALLGAIENTPFDILSKIEIKVVPFQEVESIKPDDRTVFALSFMTPAASKHIELFRKLKSLNPNVLFVAGGPHPSGRPNELVKLGFDFVVVGEGESSFPELLTAIVENELDRPVRGVFSRFYGFGGLRRPIDLNQFQPYSLKFRRFMPIEIVRGCPFACKFCQTSFFFGRKPRYRSLENILEAAEVMIKHGLRDFRFIAPNALSWGSEDGLKPNFEALEMLLSELRRLIGKERRIFFGTFPSEIRPEFVSDRTMELLSRFVDNRSIVIGAQTGSERLMKAIGRRHTVEDVLKAVRTANRWGFRVDVDFIFGLPGETENDVKLTVEFMRKLLEYNIRIHTHVFMPLVGTPFSGKPHGRVHELYRRFLSPLVGKGKVFGKW